MPANLIDRRAEIADVLRGRVLRALEARALRPGDRLPSARELASEFAADYRLVVAAYRLLAAEGLVELQARGGIYVASAYRGGQVPLPSEKWLTDVVAQGLAREIPLTQLGEWVERALTTVRLRAAAIQGTPDQVEGICRELEDSYGLDARGVAASELGEDELPVAIRRADLLVTTPAYADLVRPIAEKTGKHLVVVDVRDDLLQGEWRLLLRRPVYVVASDERFARTVRRHFSRTPGAEENLRILLVGRDDLSVIPDGATVYITRSARSRLAGSVVRGRILPSARTFDVQASRQIIRWIVSRNLDALSALRPGDEG